MASENKIFEPQKDMIDAGGNFSTLMYTKNK